MTDAQLLELMHARDVEGATASVLARRVGRTRSAICGLWFRIDRDTDVEEHRQLQPEDMDFEGGPVIRPRNMDGGMPPRWWDHNAQDACRPIACKPDARGLLAWVLPALATAHT